MGIPMDGSLLWSDTDFYSPGQDPRRPEWVAHAYRQFAANLLAPAGYPCHFGVQAQRLGNHWFTAIDTSAAEPVSAALAGTLLNYLKRAQVGSKRQSLVVFVGPPWAESDFDGDLACFWDVLSGLRDVDPAAWPADVPQDPRDPEWRWCFAGEPWFVFAASPNNRARRSRNLGDCLTFVFQTMRVFDGLIGATEPWHAAKQLIRARIDKYDTVPLHPHLSDTFTTPAYRWRYAVLPDDQSVLDPAACPYDPERRSG